jgi:hypothetical protein
LCVRCSVRAVLDHCGGPNVVDSSCYTASGPYYYQVIMQSNQVTWLPEHRLSAQLDLVISYWHQQERLHVRRGRAAPHDGHAPRSYSPSRTLLGNENGDRFAAHSRVQQSR